MNDAKLPTSGNVSTMLKVDSKELHVIAERVVSALCEIIVGKPGQIRLALTALLSGGHLLLEDLPGMGKTTLAHGIAASLGLAHNRLQFTSDLLPADVLGVSVFRQVTGEFEFQSGPIFTQLLLADELNRAAPKTQSALLEAMAERQVTMDGETRALPQPFFVIATQNPQEQAGAFPLPESQLDRFLMSLSLGYPNARAEREMLCGADRQQMLGDLQPIARVELLQAMQAEAAAVHVAPTAIDYVQALLSYSRDAGVYRHGLSPRAGLALLAASRAWAWLAGRDHVLPDDIQAVVAAVARHRLSFADEFDDRDPAQCLIEAVAIPQ